MSPAPYTPPGGVNRLASQPFQPTFRRVSAPTPPQVTPPVRLPAAGRTLPDVLAWPIALSVLCAGALVYVLPRFVPDGWVRVGVGVVCALLTVALIAWLNAAVQRWLRERVTALAAAAESSVRRAGVGGLADQLESSPLGTLALAFAEAGGRDGLRAAERQHAAVVDRLGRDVAGGLAVMADRGGAVHADVIRSYATALRSATELSPATVVPVNVVAEVRSVLAAATLRRPLPAVDLTIDLDRAMVLIDHHRFAELVEDLVTLAQSASPADARVTVHLSRVFRSMVVETPVRRAGDSRLTIVPRASSGDRPAWVERTQPAAEVLSLVVSDAGVPPTPELEQRALDAFAAPRAGDPLGVVLARAQRTVHSALGTIWVAESREGGTAVHVLLPIAASGA